jgi:hypothetical protein
MNGLDDLTGREPSTCKANSTTRILARGIAKAIEPLH